MLKYRNANNKDCQNKDPEKFNMEKCNDSLYANIIDNKSINDEIGKNTVEFMKLSMEIAFGKILATSASTDAADAADAIKKKQEQVENLKNINASLQQQIANNIEYLYEKRCIFMTFKEYFIEKVHINNNMFCHVFKSINEANIKKEIKNKLEDIKNNRLRPASLKKIPLPIYAMFAKKLEKIKNESVFLGNYEVILYIPNLYNYNKDEKDYKEENALYTLFPSLDAFSKQNRWMELMTSIYSKYLDVIKIGTLKDSENKIIKNNFFKNDLTNTCLNMGCVAAEKDAVRIPTYSTSSSELNTNVEGVSPYLPSACLQTPYYNKQMMNLNDKDAKRFRGSANVLVDNFDIKAHCSPEKKKKYEEEKEKDKESFDVFLCKEIERCDKYEDKEEPDYKDGDDKICDKPKDERIPDLMSYFFVKNFKAGTDSDQYSREYNDNILKEMAFRKSKYPGFGDDIQEIVFRMFVINEKLFDENWFCYMPWGNMLLKQDYVINEQETLEIDRVSFKSFNNVFEMKFHGDGYLYIYENKNRKFQVPNQSKNLSCFKKRILRFENMLLNIYGYDEHNNYDLRGSVALTNNDMYVSPASIILSNDTGEIILYDLGINNKSV